MTEEGREGELKGVEKEDGQRSNREIKKHKRKKEKENKKYVGEGEEGVKIDFTLLRL